MDVPPPWPPPLASAALGEPRATAAHTASVAALRTKVAGPRWSTDIMLCRAQAVTGLTAAARERPRAVHGRRRAIKHHEGIDERCEGDRHMSFLGSRVAPWAFSRAQICWTGCCRTQL
eukprot:3627263-Prymnesium_polylepis.1